MGEEIQDPLHKTASTVENSNAFNLETTAKLHTRGTSIGGYRSGGQSLSFFTKELVVKQCIGSTLGDEFGMLAGLNNAPLFENDNPIRLQNSRESVCDNDAGSSFHQLR